MNAVNPRSRGRAYLRVEVLLVLALSLGRSAVYSVVDLVQALTRAPLSSQSSSLNSSLSDRPGFDLVYQLLNVGFTIVPAFVALFLLGQSVRAGARLVGLDLRRVGKDSLLAIGLAAGIGIPGLVLYVVGYQLGISVEVVASDLGAHWWTVPILVLQAAKNAVIEEVIVVGYLLRRLDDLGWRPGRALIASALLRGAYHLYQGFGGGLGNLVMGLVFGRVFQRTGRVGPLIVAHTLLDVVAFVGYALLKDHLSFLP